MIQAAPGLIGATTGVLLAVLVVALFLAFVRLVRGPSLPDRVVALELSGTLVVGIIAVYAIKSAEAVYLDVAIALALIGFLGTVAFARFLERGGDAMIVRDVLAVALMVVGVTLMLLAAVGVVRMPDLYSRMQSATKASTLGVGCTLLAVAVEFADLAITTRVLLIISFILLTAPVSAHMIGRAAYYIGVPLWEGTRLDELRDHHGPPTPPPDGPPPEPPAA